MSSLNKVILVGRLGRDPDERMTAGGTRVSNFSMATDHYRATNGDPQQVTEWHRVVAFGKLAEKCIQYLRKGRLVCVEGSLQTRSWERAPGERHFTTEIVAARVAFLDSKGKNDPSGLGPESEAETEAQP